MKQSGFTLLEVLVAMLVLSIGLLGLAGLMASSMRNNQSAYHSTQATWLAYDILDRIRANRAGALAGAYDGASLGSPAACTAFVPTGAIASQDISGWKNMLACALPDGDGSITVTPGNRQVRIVVQWNDSRGTKDQGSVTETEEGGSTRQFVVESRL
jgi:type IV pilus assembly protein PilV